MSLSQTTSSARYAIKMYNASLPWHSSIPSVRAVIDSPIASTTLPVSVEEALEALAELPTRAEESCSPVPPENLKQKAEMVMQALPYHMGLMFDVYPMSKGEIVLDASSSITDGSVLLTLHPDGSAWCNVLTDHRSRRAWYSDADDWPDGFIVEALGEIAGIRRGPVIVSYNWELEENWESEDYWVWWDRTPAFIDSQYQRAHHEPLLLNE